MKVPTFAIIGHPNEGKSSVLSTLAEDDSVRVSSVPGETTTNQIFPVRIDGRELIRFIDTPGFQNPRKALAWMQDYRGPEEQLFENFLASHHKHDDFRDDCELLGPVVEGAGVIFVVDGSRPVRNHDRAEMEILRLTGAPRMAVINSKEADCDFIDDWQNAFRKHFNAIRIFNSCRATYSERIELLESLKGIDQQLEPLLRQVISAFEQDWLLRSERTAQLISELLVEALTYRETADLASRSDEKTLHARLLTSYRDQLAKQERKTQDAIRALFKHNIFNLQLPQQSILTEDLFSGTTWEFLGLSDKQLIAAGAVGGATVGASIDAAVGGASFGIGAAIGGLVGATGALIKGKRLIESTKLFGHKIGGELLVVGPASNSQLLFILIDRCLLFYSHIINWAHGRRDYQQHLELTKQTEKQGYTSDWNQTERKVCQQLFRALQKKDTQAIAQQRDKLNAILRQQLEQISRK
jgi:signal recognition particle receptor subunit beta/IS1 family transposase